MIFFCDAYNFNHIDLAAYSNVPWKLSSSGVKASNLLKSSLHSNEKDRSLATTANIISLCCDPILLKKIKIPLKAGLMNGLRCDKLTFCLSCTPVMLVRVATPFPDMELMWKGPVQLLSSFPPFHPSFLLLAFKTSSPTLKKNVFTFLFFLLSNAFFPPFLSNLDVFIDLKIKFKKIK